MPATSTDPGLKKYPPRSWAAQPFLGTQIHYEKYAYDDETIEDVAKKHDLTWQDLAFANWGVSDIAHVNWYLSQRHKDTNHPKTEAQVGGQASFKLLTADEPHEIWVPRDRKITSNNASKNRKPSPFAMGHVAPADTDKFPDQVNTLADQPIYEISLQLGDLDALFDPMVPTGGAPPHVAHAIGIQQRLQVLGFFYWPLGLSNARRNGYAEVAWNYFKKIHAWKDPMFASDVLADAAYTVADLSLANNGVFAANMKGSKVKFTLIETAAEVEIATATADMLTFDPVNGIDPGDNFEIDDVPGRQTLNDTYTLERRSLRKVGAFSPDMQGRKIRFKVTETRQEREILAATANMITFDRVVGLKRGDRFKIEPQPTIEPTDDQAKRILRFEVRNNILAVLLNNDRFPEKGEILDGRLPKAEKPGVVIGDRGTDQYGMIRIPGGYTFNWPRPAQRVTVARQSAPNATDADAAYDFNMSKSRFDYEKLFYKDNVYLGRIPLIAKVDRVKNDGKREPAAGVSVYFQLVMPDAMATNPLCAPTLRRVELDKTKDWEKANAMPIKPVGVTQNTWDTLVGGVANNAMGQAEGATRTNWITTNATGAGWNDGLRNRLNAAVNAAQVIRTANAAPYTTGDTDVTHDPTKGPAKFIHDAMATADTAENDPTNPQHPNARETFGGTRGLPVEGQGAGVNYKPGVFEVKEERKGLHSKRDDDHPDYGTLTLVTAIPDEVKADHAHAVTAKTNDKGLAGLVFMPSRLGGDSYRLRAYVGPESLGFKGDAEDGPVVETGTLTVWRNIRFCGYYRRKVPKTTAGQPRASATVRGLFNPASAAVRTWGQAWNRVNGDALYNTHLVRGATRTWARNQKKRLAHYRPVEIDFKSLIDTYRQAFIEFVLDAKEPTDISDDDYRAAIQKTRDAARTSGQVAKTVDWNLLILDDPTSPWTITTRSLADYNANRNTATFPQALAYADFNDMVFVEVGMTAFAEQFTGGGLHPGVTMMHLASDLNASHVYRNSGSSWGAGGLGTANGGFYMIGAYTDAQRGDVPLEGGVTHEAGHCLLFVHGPIAAGGPAARHQDRNDCICIMDYCGCYGEFCGRCLLKLRGWKVQRANADGGA